MRIQIVNIILRVIVALASLFPLTATAEEENPVIIDEWAVPFEDSRPRDPYFFDNEHIWFVGQGSDYIAYLNANTGHFNKIPLDDGVGPHNLIVGNDGTVWYAGNRQRHIGRYRPDEGIIHKIPMPDAAARDPHTLVFDGMGHIWFTMQSGNRIGRLNIESENIDIIEVPTTGARPYGIIVTPAGRPWIALFGTNRLATIDPATLEIQEIEIPRAQARPRRIEQTSDGLIWYVDYAGGYLGRYDPDSGEFREFAAPSGENSRPYGFVSDDEDRLWFVETGVSPNQLVGFDAASETFISITEIPSGAGAVRHMYFDAGEGNIWFGTDFNTIGRARIR
jgi:virginiamycin B lyase